MLTFRFETRARFNNFSYNQVFDLFKQKITQDNLTKKKLIYIVLHLKVTGRVCSVHLCLVHIFVV